MYDKQTIRKALDKLIDNIQFLSPNEPITPYGIQRILDQMADATTLLEEYVGSGSKTITMWNPNVTYQLGDMVLYFKEEAKQVSVEQGKREYAFILVSINEGGNNAIPNYDIVDGLPVFDKSGWRLLNPLSYLLQNLESMREVVKEVFTSILEEHVEDEHGIQGSEDISRTLLKKDYSNLLSPWELDKYSVAIKEQLFDGGNTMMVLHSNGVMEYKVRYSFDMNANQQIRINDNRYYRQRSPIWDESDQTIFSQKYMEDTMLSVSVNPDNPQQFNNLRYGTNIFNKHISFAKDAGKTPFMDDEYMVFFDTYQPGAFVFGYDVLDIQSQEEPTYDQVVSMPMLMNKTSDGFDIVLPIHTYFNSIQKYNIGVPWNNSFTLQVIGRYARD